MEPRPKQISGRDNTGSLSDGKPLKSQSGGDTDFGVDNGELILIEKKEITSAVTTVTFSGLDGNADGIYILYASIISGTSAGSVINIYINPNGVTTNQTTERKLLSTSYTFDSVSRLQIASNFGASESNHTFSICRIWAMAAGPGSTTLRRQFKSDSQRGVSTFLYAGEWTDTSTNITSLEIESSVASNIDVGTTLILYKLASAAA